uniref:Uncharacterized protein n=1 Tax=Aegilops tauschii subsp. strangulata TaxID=200361 RepID=A0A453MMY5_AEGTS
MQTPKHHEFCPHTYLLPVSLFQPSSPLTDVIQEFYSSLNDKDITRLEKLISLDCVIEDTAYYKPLDVKVLPACISLSHLLQYLCIFNHQAIINLKPGSHTRNSQKQL